MKDNYNDTIQSSVQQFLEEILKNSPDYSKLIEILDNLHKTKVTDSNIGTYIKDLIWIFINNKRTLAVKISKYDERVSHDPAYYKVFNYFVKKNKFKFSRTDTSEVLNNFIETCQIVFLASKSINSIPDTITREDYNSSVIPDLEDFIEIINASFILFFKNEYSINEAVRFHHDHSNRGLISDNNDEENSEINKEADAEEEMEDEADYSKYEYSDENDKYSSAEIIEDSDTSIEIYEVDTLENRLSAFQDKITKLNKRISVIEETNNLLIPKLEKMAIILHYKNKIDSNNIEINKIIISQNNMCFSIQKNKTLLRVTKKIINDTITKSRNEVINTLVNNIITTYNSKNIKVVISLVFKNIDGYSMQDNNLKSNKEQIKVHQQEIELLTNRIKNSENCNLLPNIYTPAGIAQLRRRGLIMERLSKKEPDILRKKL